MPIGVSCAIICASWPAPEGKRTEESFTVAAARATMSCIATSASAGGLLLTGTMADRRPRLGGDGLRPLSNVVGDSLQRGRRKIAQLDGGARFARYDVRGIGRHFDPADRANVAARAARHDLSHRQRQVRQRDHSILSIRHRCGSRVVGKPGDGRLEALDRHNALDDADVRRRSLERSALLDVQLEVAAPRALLPPGIHDALGIAADLADCVAASHAVPDLIHVRGRDITRDDTAGREPAVESDPFLCRPDDEFQWVPRADAPGSEALDEAEPGERAEIAVEVAAARDRINMGAEENRRERRLGSGAAAEDVPGWIDPRSKPGRTHQTHDVVASGDVGIAVGDAAHAGSEAAAGRTPEHAELLDALAERCGIDRESAGGLRLRHSGPGKASGGETREEGTPREATIINCVVHERHDTSHRPRCQASADWRPYTRTDVRRPGGVAYVT